MAKVSRTYLPDPGNKAICDRNYRVFKKRYKANAASFRAMGSHSSP